MHFSAALLSAFIAGTSASGVTSSLDLHVTTGSAGLQAQMTTNIRDGMRATVSWNSTGVTGHAVLTVGPASVTLDKSDDHPLRIDVAGLSAVSPPHAADRPERPRLIAANAPFVAPPSAGFLDSLGAFSNTVLGEIAQWVRTMVPFLLLGLLFIVLIPGLGAGVRGTAMRAPWERLGIGLLALIAMPSAAVALLVGGIFLGVWWLGLMMLGLYAVALAAGYTYAGMVVGRAVLDRLGGTRLHIFWALLFGLALVSVLTLIPYAGAFAALASVTYGMGALVLAPRTAPATTLPRLWLQQVWAGRLQPSRAEVR